VLSLAPLKRLAQSARVVSSEPRPQPLCAEPLPVQVEEGLVVASVAEESSVPPPPATITTVEEERTAMEMAAPSVTGAASRGRLGWHRSGHGALRRRLGVSPVGEGS
jgi:hypothetical protein